MKKNISFNLKTTYLVLGLLLNLAIAKSEEVLFSEKFDNDQPLESRFEVTAVGNRKADVPRVVAKEMGALTMTGPMGSTLTIKSLVTDEWKDSGTAPILYSASYASIRGTLILSADLFVRMSDFSSKNAYKIQHYYDGTSAVVVVTRFNVGVETKLYICRHVGETGEEATGKNQFPVLQTRRGKVSAILTNNEKSVSIKIYFLDKFLVEVIDESPDRILTGQSVGFNYYNNENDNRLGMTDGLQLYSLEVIANPKLAESH